ncbi:MAG TPA: hypothetical protein VFZ66_05070, partial [Herpetosiphonaceae bacterium]
MSLTPNRPRQPSSRPPVRWSLWELALLAISLVMIASPLFAAGYALLVPTVAPAQESGSGLMQTRPTECPTSATGTPCPTPPPTETPSPTPTDVTPPTPSPSASPYPGPSDTPTPSP